MKFIHLIILSTCFLCFGCTAYEISYPQLNPIEAKVICSLDTDYKIEKAVYSQNSNTIFVMEQNKIHLYKDKQKINSIGRLGFSKANFNKLADICLASDGNLLALDSFRKTIYKYDESGSLISELKIDMIGDPTMLSMATDEKLFIYDNAAKEVIILDPTQQTDIFSFGKFTFKEPTHLSIYKNFIYVYDQMSDKTYIFNSFGQQTDEFPGFRFFNQFQNYILKKFYFIHANSSKKFHITANEIQNCFVSETNIIIIHNHKLAVIEMKYERKQ
ncbi:MAG: hypothetical protein KAS49_08660 [Candidatus Cloacimonetes bacterium]|nr:hypothetical protein [Candidatus Cloacimonadota bacterium]